MTNPARMALLVPLRFCCYLLTHSPSSLAGPLGPPELHRPGAKFGGMYRRVLHNNPSTLDPAFSTDIHGGVVVRQIFDSLVQFDADLKPLPPWQSFGRRPGMAAPRPSPCPGGARFITDGR
jgi:hypothetical protein